MNKLIMKWNGRSIEDAGPIRSAEFKAFASEFRRVLKRLDGWQLIKFSTNHYNCTAFLKKGDRYVYISHDVPRGGQPLNMYATDPFFGILYRTAKHEKDYTGGMNHFTNFANLEADLNDLIA